jgi:FtsZ-interacting cell division protein ZipA
MSDLVVCLIVVGVLAMVGLVGYNKWQEYRARKSMERSFPSEPHDALLTPHPQSASVPPAFERQEPKFEAAQHVQGDKPVEPNDALPASGKPSQTELVTMLEDKADMSAEQQSLEPVAAAAATVSATVEVAPTELPVDELIDCVIPIALEQPVSGSAALQAFHPLDCIGSKAIHYIGKDESGQWNALSPQASYVSLLAGVQMADRSSPLTDIEYSDVVMRLRRLADPLGGDPELPDMAEVIHIAHALHAFVTEHDVTLGFNVRSNKGPWGLTTLLVALTRQGFDRQADGSLSMSDGEQGALFSLSTNVRLGEPSTSLLTLRLRVPLVMAERQAYQSMVSCAKALAARLDGHIVDDGGQLLNDAQLGEIGAQVMAFYQDMDAAGIAAGSIRAQRLFS